MKDAKLNILLKKLYIKYKLALHKLFIKKQRWRNLGGKKFRNVC